MSPELTVIVAAGLNLAVLIYVAFVAARKNSTPPVTEDYDADTQWDRRAAWDMYAAGAIVNINADQSAQQADQLLAERDKRFPVKL